MKDIPDMKDYTSGRVYDGVRQLDAASSKACRDRLKRAIASKGNENG